MSGTIIQPVLAGSWDLEKWKAELQYMKDACIKQVILQWTADSLHKTTVYPTQMAGYRQSDGYKDVVGLLFAAADAKDVDVFLGLQTNEDWYRKSARDNAWLNTSENSEANFAVKLSKELSDNYGQRPEFKRRFKGWYLPFEVDNQNFDSADSRNNLTEFYVKTGTHLHQLSPGTIVISAPYYNTSGGMNSAAWKAMWIDVLDRAPLDVLALQDGIGPLNDDGKTYHATLQQLPEWFGQTKAAIDEVNRRRNRSVQLWADTETYIEDRTAIKCKNPATDECRYPLPTKRLVEDMRAVQPYVKNYVSFSFNHYMSPHLPWLASNRTYREYLKTGAVDIEAPRLTGGFVAKPEGASLVSLAWSPSTDKLGLLGYKIYRNDFLTKTVTVTTVYEKEGEPCSILYDDKAESKTKYEYRIEAFDAAGNLSVESSHATVTTSEFTHNVAIVASYISSLPADLLYPDTDGSELTDGVFGDTSSFLEWQGRNTSQTYSFVIDLGTEINVREINSRWLQKKADSVFLPKTVNYSISGDGHNFAGLGIVNSPPENNCNGAFSYSLLGLNKIGRYIKLEVIPNNAWSMASEVEVLSQ